MTEDDREVLAESERTLGAWGKTSDVSELLRVSRDRHQAAATARQSKSPEAPGLLAEAAAYRLAALELDPDMMHHSWDRDRAKHADLLAFYRKMGAIQ